MSDWIVVSNDIENGFDFIGPFKSELDAVNYSMREDVEGIVNGVIVKLKTPMEVT